MIMGKAEPLISILIPVYNTGEDLVACLNSVVSQTYRNIEVIIIDDGSVDESPEICDRFAASDERVHVIHKPNAGVSAARNDALDAASGEYIYFMDSDDYNEPNTIERLYTMLTEYSADISVSGYCRELDGKVVETDVCGKERELYTDTNEICKCLFNEKLRLTASAGNKLYRAELFNGVRYSEGHIHEDKAVAHLLMLKAGRVIYFNDVLYHYRQRKGSITHTRPSEGFVKDLWDAMLGRFNAFKDTEDKELLSLCIAEVFDMSAYCYCVLKQNCPESREFLQQLRKDFIEIYGEYSPKISAGFKKRLKWRIYRTMPRLYVKWHYARR